MRCQHAYRSPLYLAVLENQLDVAKLLFDRGANPLDVHTDDSMLAVASMRGYGEMHRCANGCRFRVLNLIAEGGLAEEVTPILD